MDHDIIDELITDWHKEKPALDASSMEVVGRLIILGKALEKSAGKAIQNSNLNYTDLDVLATLRRSGSPYELSPKELMQSVLITSGSMTTLLERLKKLNYITRTSDHSDARVKKAKLTPKGISVIDEAIILRFNDARNSISSLSTQEQKQLAQLLKKLILSLYKH